MAVNTHFVGCANFEDLSLMERCQHKAWRARVSGYEEATKMFRQSVNNLQNWIEVRPLVVVEIHFYCPTLALLCFLNCCSGAAALQFSALLV